MTEAEILAIRIGVTTFGGERPDYLSGLTLYQSGALLGFIAFGAIYLALVDLTFGNKWPDTEAPKHHALT